MSRRSSVSDGWEEVDSDTFSIISAPSDDDTPAAPGQERGRASTPETTRDTKTTRPATPIAISTVSPTPSYVTDDGFQYIDLKSTQPKHTAASSSAPTDSAVGKQTQKSPVDGTKTEPFPVLHDQIPYEDMPRDRCIKKTQFTGATTIPRRPSNSIPASNGAGVDNPFKDPSSSAEPPNNAGSDDNLQLIDFDSEPRDPESNIMSLIASITPKALNKGLASLKENLQETRQQLSDLSAIEPSAVGELAPLCRHLAAQVAELEPIFLTYDQIWAKKSSEITLDPSINDWISCVRVKLIGVGSELQRISRAHRTPGLELAADAVLDAYCEDLGTLEAQMEEFLPIIQVDFNEFQMANMTLPSLCATNPAQTLQQAADANGNSAKAMKKHSVPSVSDMVARAKGPGNPILASDHLFLLRRDLYNLKDEIHSTIKCLAECTSVLPPSAAALATDITSSYLAVHSNVSTMLSNHGSDWIDNGITGGLTYAEFVGLDCDTLRDFAFNLKSMWSWYRLRNKHSGKPDAPRVDREQINVALLDAGGLDQLETLAEVLTAVLGPQRSS